MQFRPRPLEGNVNVATTHPLVELAWLAGGLAGLLSIAYLFLGLAVDWVAPRVPYAMERSLDERLWPAPAGDLDPRTTELQMLLDRVSTAAPQGLGPVRLQMIVSPAVNAAALPGGRVLVFSGLLEQAESENEVAMVLAHELGHVVHRDPLRALGRGLVLAFLASSLVGEERSVETFVGGSLTLGHLRYSRQQEQAADRFAVETLVALYGHAGGATALFQKMRVSGRDGHGRGALSTHPGSGARVAAIEALIAERAFPVSAPTPLPEDWRSAILRDADTEPE
ncbi:MAG TPA: M48 family metallopeptidase [Deferrisomatales bacterium]|nr:M48 family metallopeptidase [Deferrisomatales bacterium]